MFSPDQYQLLDFGAGRKLERFGSYVLDRPAPAASAPSREPPLWQSANARYERTTGEQGVWSGRARLAESWPVRWEQIVLELKPTDFGHLGLFPEHARCWQWLGERARAAARPPKVLNLFGYTGAATLALAAAGAEVVHVDAARPAVAWARRNAELSGLGGAPIRWIVEDARRFVARELKRGNTYDGVVLDPPTYGHGPQGQSWKFSTGAAPLLADCVALTRRGPGGAALGADARFVLLTCHTPGVGPGEIEALLAAAGAAAAGQLTIEPLELISAAGGRLACGIEARWVVQPS